MKYSLGRELGGRGLVLVGSMVREGIGNATVELGRDKVLEGRSGRLDGYVMAGEGKVHMPLHRCGV